MISIIVPTCDLYKDLISPYKYLMEKYWAGYYKTYVVGFSKPEDVEFNEHFNFVSLGKTEIPWSNRLIYILNKIPDKFFILLLEDYFISQTIDADEIWKRFRYLKQHLNVGKMDLSTQIAHHKNKGQFLNSDYVYADMAHAEYLCSFQPAIWNKAFFLRFILPNWNAWQTEVGMSRRCNSEYKDGFMIGNDKHVMPNVNAVLKGKANVNGLKGMENWQSIPNIDKILNMNYRVK